LQLVSWAPLEKEELSEKASHAADNQFFPFPGDA
jgi:hypothetical protein